MQLLHNLIDDEDESGNKQLSYYDEGVGTGLFDGITGGGFGFGLNTNVREAYNWLIRNYRDGDRLFVFGFSRGAYTARSLIGFISQCGLLKKGAPITVNQLWEQYVFLGREREDSKSPWETIAGQKDTEFSSISSIKPDNFEHDEEEARLEKRLKDGDVSADLNEREKLLCKYSRRIPIRFLGIFDTVGALGVDALAIPGLRGRLSLHHNMRVSSVIHRCFHALAIDEYRSSFNHTPMVQYLKNDWKREKVDKERNAWAKRLQQRWFVGAHSNIGGSYPDNLLAQRPLNWIIEGAKKEGLVISSGDPEEQVLEPKGRVDSFARFAKPFWTEIVRAKRNYRHINPEPDMRLGYSLENINESIDDGTEEALAELDEEKQGSYLPPHLDRYFDPELAPEKKKVPLGHGWLEQHDHLKSKDKTFSPRVVLIMWSVLASYGLIGFAMGVQPDWEAGTSDFLPILQICLAAFFVFVDRVEHHLNFKKALEPTRGILRARLDVLYWLRAVGVILFFAGVYSYVFKMIDAGWHSSLCDSATILKDSFLHYWTLPAAAFGAVLFIDLISGKPAKIRSCILSGIVAPLALLVIGCVICFATVWFSKAFPVLENTLPSGGIFETEPRKIEGWLLLFQVALLFLAKAFAWQGGPLRVARLPKMKKLRWAGTPNRAIKYFDGLVELLHRKWDDKGSARKAAKLKVCELVSETMHRDNLGLVPVYSAVLGLGMWIGVTYLGKGSENPWFAELWDWLNDGLSWSPFPIWATILIVTVVADYIENLLHLYFNDQYRKGQNLTLPLTLTAGAATLVKSGGFIAALIFSVLSFVELSSQVVFTSESLNWRGMLSGTISIGLVIVLAILVIAFFKKLFDESREKSRTAD